MQTKSTAHQAQSTAYQVNRKLAIWLTLACHAIGGMAAVQFTGSGSVAILHQIGIFGRVFVETAQDRDGSETALAEEYLRIQICFAHFQHDAVATLGC